MIESIKWFWKSIDLHKWEFEGHELVRIDTILRRCITFPLLIAVKWLYVFLVFLGWGYKDACYTYEYWE